MFDITLDEEVMWEVAIGKSVVRVDMVATKQLFGKYTQYRLKYPYDRLRVNWRKSITKTARSWYAQPYFPNEIADFVGV